MPREPLEMPSSVVLSTDTATNCDVAPDGRIPVVRATLQESISGHLVVALDGFERRRRAVPIPGRS